MQVMTDPHSGSHFGKGVLLNLHCLFFYGGQRLCNWTEARISLSSFSCIVLSRGTGSTGTHTIYSGKRIYINPKEPETWVSKRVILTKLTSCVQESPFFFLPLQVPKSIASPNIRTFCGWSTVRQSWRMDIDCISRNERKKCISSWKTLGYFKVAYRCCPVSIRMYLNYIYIAKNE